jgi:hypothetical protein
MKRLLVVLVLTLIATAVAAAPAFAASPFIAPRGAPVVHQASAGAATVPASVAFASAHIPRAGTVGWAATKGASPQVAKTYSRGMSVIVPSAGRSAAGVGVAALLVLVIGGAVYAMVADRRRPASAMSISQPARFSSYQTAEQKREAA